MKKGLLERPWQVVREGVQVKPLPQEKELYVLPQSTDRVNKERGMRRRQLKGLAKRLKELQAMELSRDPLLLKLGAAKQQFPSGRASGIGAGAPSRTRGQPAELCFQTAHRQPTAGT